jgi:hypothetical protein
VHHQADGGGLSRRGHGAAARTGLGDAGIVAELRSGLLNAADAHRSAGLPPTQAALAEIREFGDPAQVAGGFRAEIAAGKHAGSRSSCW